MINSDRIVPITKTDLLTSYGTTLKLTGVSVSALNAADTAGDFEQTTNSATVICSEPVKALNFGSSVTAATVYFVPAYDYKGFTKTSATLTVSGDVTADGCTLYKAALSTNALTITKEGF